MFGVITTQANEMCVHVKKPLSSCATPSLDIEVPIHGDKGQVLDAICEVAGNKTDPLFLQFSDPSKVELLLVSSSLVNISKKGTAADSLRNRVTELKDGFKLSPPGPGSVAQNRIQFCVYLKNPGALGGGKSPAIPSQKPGGSGATGPSRDTLYGSYKSDWIGTTVLEYEKAGHGNSNPTLKRLSMQGTTKEARRKVLIGILTISADKVITAEMSKLEGPSRVTKLQMHDLFGEEFSKIDMDNLPAGVSQIQRFPPAAAAADDVENAPPPRVNPPDRPAVPQETEETKIDRIIKLRADGKISEEQMTKAINKVLGI
jgi:hypothetical protein